MPTKWRRGALSIALLGVLCGCAVAPRPMDAEERAKLAADTRRQMFEGQDALDEPLTLSQAVIYLPLASSGPKNRTAKTKTA